MADYDHDIESKGLTPEEETEDIEKDDNSIDRHSLDTDPQTLKYKRMVFNWWHYERQKQADNRSERMNDHEFYDGYQWEEEDETELDERGQAAYVFNLIKPSCDWLIGTERRTRVDYAVLPRRKEEAPQAERKTKYLKYLDDVCKTGFARSLAFKDTVISGLGWIDDGIRSDESDEPIYSRYEDWRNVWHDSHAKERDLSDGRYLFRSKVVDYDIAVAMFPDRADCIRAALHESSNSSYVDEEYDESDINPELDELSSDGAFDSGHYRRKVRLVSCEYRVPSKVKVIRGKGLGTLNGTIHDDSNEHATQLVEAGHASLYDAVRMVMWKMVFCGRYVLQNNRRVYNHDRFSLTPIWCYRRKKDNSPYGVVRNIIDPQVDLNKRRSKAIFLLSTKQAILEEDAIEDIDEFINEKDRPDGVMTVKSGKIDKVKLLEERGLAREHVMLMDQDRQFIESTGGVTDENRGIETNATSGKAIERRQEQGHVVNAELFDNYKYGFLISGENRLSLIEQYAPEERVIRITGDKGQTEFVEINKPGENGEVENDITSTQADFVIEADNFHATIRQAMAEKLGEMITKLPPEISMHLVDLWISLSPELPSKEKEIALERIRGAFKLSNPDEDPDDPKVQARKQAEQAEMERQRQIEDTLIQLDIAMKKAEVALKEAETEERRAEVEKDLAEARAKLASITFNIEKNRIEKAKVLHEIEQKATKPATP